ncbi:MAG TPA: Gfo/Idh/MocA family oxidoreductase, partial [Ktedonobacteraceae bacterium]|nr:Gfo/Idh/MocA family oxidoreductase [Ktedonobacteraceae bacterium]
MDQLRIGVLGAARIVPSALLSPARQVPEASVVTLGARDTRKAQEFARKHQIPRVATSYDDVLADPEVDAVYIPLPNNLHARWTLQALKAGKHVLCEKPFAANADEAEEMARAAEQSGKVVMEAFH